MNVHCIEPSCRKVEAEKINDQWLKEGKIAKISVRRNTLCKNFLCFPQKCASSMASYQKLQRFKEIITIRAVTKVRSPLLGDWKCLSSCVSN